MTDTDIERLDQVVRVRPGDRVLLTIRDGFNVDPKYIDHMRESLRERFPDVEFTIVAGLDIAAIERD